MLEEITLKRGSRFSPHYVIVFSENIKKLIDMSNESLIKRKSFQLADARKRKLNLASDQKKARTL